MHERAQQVAEALVGSCEDLENHATHDERMNKEFCESLDELTQQCQTCDWWVETDELDEEGNCTDCQE